MTRNEALNGSQVHDGRKTDRPATPQRSRRAIIGGGLAAAGVGIAGTLIAATPASADDDGTPLLLGDSNQATDTTSLQNTSGACFTVASATGQPVITATDSSTSNPGGSPGVYASSETSAGVVGMSESNSAVVGVSASGSGVFGQSTSAYGVEAQLAPGSTTLGIAAVFGFDPTAAPGNTGVQGESFNGTGVAGYANVGQGSGGTGVFGQTYGDGGAGVGASDSSTGGGFGLVASTNNGVAINAYVSSEGNGSGLALQIGGPCQFMTAGTAVIPSGSASVTVDVDHVTTASFVLATLQELAPDHHVAAAVAGENTVTIYLNRVTAVARPVGFFAIMPYGVGAATNLKPSLPTSSDHDLGRMIQAPSVPSKR
jgi:hypothetical protein